MSETSASQSTGKRPHYLPTGLQPGWQSSVTDEQDAGSAIGRAANAMASAHSLDEILVIILDSCVAVSKCSYSSVALVRVRGHRLAGPMFFSTEAAQSVHLVESSSGPELVASLEYLNEHRLSASPPGPAVPSQDISLPLDCTENLMVKSFTVRQAQSSTCFHDLLRPLMSPRMAVCVSERLKIGCITVLPLLVADECFGVLAVGFPLERPPTESDCDALDILVNLAAVSVARARLKQELRDREQQVSLLLKATIDAQEEERERICLDIHDGVAQTLAPAFQYLQALDSRPELSGDLRTMLHKAASMVRTAIREAREVIATLRPAALDALGLVSTLHFEVEELSIQTGQRIEFVADQARLPKAVETALYRIVHEAITNVTKHASANWMALHLKQERDHVRIEVRDNGVGFDHGDVDGQVIRKGFGLLSMRKRAELLGGKLEVVSGCGNGTIVRVIVPLGRLKPEGSGSVVLAGVPEG